MTSRRKDKGKEHAGSSHRVTIPAPKSDLPILSFCLFDSDSTQPPSPTPAVNCLRPDSSAQPPSDVDIDAEIPHVNSTSSGTGDKIFIYPRGVEFTSQTKCAWRIGKIMEQKFHGPWKSLKNVPINVRDMWFRELEEEWGKDHYKKVCEQNKKNHESDCDGQGYPLHIRGSITHLTHMNKLKEKHDREPTTAEAFLHMHSHLNYEGQHVWPNDRCKNAHEKYAEKYGSSSGEGDSDPLPPMTTQIEIWTEVVGRTNKGQVFGLAGRSSQRIPMTNTQGLSEREQALTDKLEVVTQRLTEMESKMASFEQFQKMFSMMQYPPHFPAPHSTSMPYPTATAPVAFPSPTTPMPYPPHWSSVVMRHLFLPLFVSFVTPIILI